MQEVGETAEAILADDEKTLEKILEENQHRSDPYWIVLFAKPSKRPVDGKPTLVKYFKAHLTKPSSQVGMVIGEVDNSKGKIKWEVNMPDIPFGYEELGLENQGYFQEETAIPEAYLYN